MEEQRSLNALNVERDFMDSVGHGSYTCSHKDSQKGGWKGDRKGNGKGTQKGEKIHAEKADTKSKKR